MKKFEKIDTLFLYEDVTESLNSVLSKSSLTPSQIIELSVLHAEIPLQFLLAKLSKEFEKNIEDQISDEEKIKICRLILASGITKKTRISPFRLSSAARQCLEDFLISEGADKSQAKAIASNAISVQDLLRPKLDGDFITKAFDSYISSYKKLFMKNSQSGRLQSEIDQVFSDPSYFSADGSFLGSVVSDDHKNTLDKLAEDLVYCSVTFCFYSGRDPYSTFDSMISDLFGSKRSMFSTFYKESILKYAESYIDRLVKPPPSALP